MHDYCQRENRTSRLRGREWEARKYARGHMNEWMNVKRWWRAVGASRENSLTFKLEDYCSYPSSKCALHQNVVCHQKRVVRNETLRTLLHVTRKVGIIMKRRELLQVLIGFMTREGHFCSWLTPHSRSIDTMRLWELIMPWKCQPFRHSWTQ